MMKKKISDDPVWIYSAAQIRDWDAFTIAHEPIRSLQLMERACSVFFDWFLTHYPPEVYKTIYIFAGTGNNGGDGVGVAQFSSILYERVELVVLDYSGKRSPDFTAQLAKMARYSKVGMHILTADSPMPEVPEQAVVIDALFGSGLSRPLTGAWEQAIRHLNALPNDIVAIDVPSGLPCDERAFGPCIKAARTLSFERPKLAFFFPENAESVGEWATLPIGLHPEFEPTATTPFACLTHSTAQMLVRSRSKFSHKGTYGHALLIAGSYGKTGAAILAARACLRAGVGLLTVHAPLCAMVPLQSAVPEAMFEGDAAETLWAECQQDLSRYSAVGVGCGIGTAPETALAMAAFLSKTTQPVVLDADALNLLAAHPEWWPMVPPDAILTPHPKEFERLFGAAPDDFSRNDLQRRMAAEKNVVIVLKGAHTAIAFPDGRCWFNTTGNPGMATGGSGDVLTGILAGLLAQGYAPHQAALLGVYLHGLAGDIAAEVYSMAAMTAGDITDSIGEAWKRLVKVYK